MTKALNNCERSSSPWPTLCIVCTSLMHTAYLSCFGEGSVAPGISSIASSMTCIACAAVGLLLGLKDTHARYRFTMDCGHSSGTLQQNIAA